jgi:hypothetical protein
MRETPMSTPRLTSLVLAAAWAASLFAAPAPFLPRKKPLTPPERLEQLLDILRARGEAHIPELSLTVKAAEVRGRTLHGVTIRCDGLPGLGGRTVNAVEADVGIRPDGKTFWARLKDGGVCARGVWTVVPRTFEVNWHEAAARRGKWQEVDEVIISTDW